MFEGQEEDVLLYFPDGLQLLQPGLVQFLALQDEVVDEVGFLAFLLDPADVAETGVDALVGGVWFVIFVSHIVIHYIHIRSSKG